MFYSSYPPPSQKILTPLSDLHFVTIDTSIFPFLSCTLSSTRLLSSSSSSPPLLLNFKLTFLYRSLCKFVRNLRNDTACGRSLHINSHGVLMI